jgi:hypothetical protein
LRVREVNVLVFNRPHIPTKEDSWAGNVGFSWKDEKENIDSMKRLMAGYCFSRGSFLLGNEMKISKQPVNSSVSQL